jgi:hypothetical protein
MKVETLYEIGDAVFFEYCYEPMEGVIESITSFQFKSDAVPTVLYAILENGRDCREFKRSEESVFMSKKHVIVDILKKLDQDEKCHTQKIQEKFNVIRLNLMKDIKNDNDV